MSTNIVVPELGESIVEATIIRWFKSEGDSVNIGEAILELETEKANFEVASEKKGVITSILKNADDDVEVGEVLGVIEEGAAAQTKAPEPAAEKVEEVVEIKEEFTAEQETNEKITPVAKNLAQELGVDISKVKGTGPSGRITKEDVENYEVKEIKEAELEAPIVEPAPKAPAVVNINESPELPIAREVREERIKMSRRRRTIARRMLEASQTTAMLTTFNEIDMSAVMELRKRRKETFKEKYGVGLGLNSFFVKASIGALKAFPAINAEIDGDDMIIKHYYDIGVAIGASEGLVVPVLKNADGMSFAEIEKKIKEYAAKSEENTLSLEDIMGGTFTITNGGVFGSLMSTPILNPPQVGILGLHKIEERPVVINGDLEVKPMMYVALSYDHRIVDGREAVQFLVRLKELIQDPESL
ncbi:MAG: 2-oxoglutarate dehydrogenase complex dihydrolipoyllysine-residue succinyltransferase, partial [Thermodesulfobacteriota bacterium]